MSLAPETAVARGKGTARCEGEQCDQDPRVTPVCCHGSRIGPKLREGCVRWQLITKSTKLL